ncbi:hypothetical protein M5X04_26810 [Paenibacillus alvei]|uniref:Uncharacterized protein n=1 Tax=Paenibacillus alvei TaxID=44250 RepID=A0ABT4EGQ3_PAEAL|nr:hypothetical protein [Paenibacillus alvei]MCY9532924.1 hypothetical protein [Paenibacillus alvei]
MSKQLTVQELIDHLHNIEDKSLPVEVSTGHEDRGGRFYGDLYRVTKVEDYKGGRVRLTGRLQEGLVWSM